MRRKPCYALQRVGSSSALHTLRGTGFDLPSQPPACRAKVALVHGCELVLTHYSDGFCAQTAKWIVLVLEHCRIIIVVLRPQCHNTQ